MKKKIWYYWCKSLGSKAFSEDNKADKVAIIRTAWAILQIITCFFICASAGRNLGFW
jgi:hypothetical protein